MSKMAALVVVFCAVLLAPVRGAWIYQGTTVWISQPHDDSCPYGTWYYGWNGNGSVDAGPLFLDVDGLTAIAVFGSRLPWKVMGWNNWFGYGAA